MVRGQRQVMMQLAEIFSSPYQEREREREAIMSPTQMDLPLFQGIQDTRTDTLQIPTFRLQPV